MGKFWDRFRRFGVVAGVVVVLGLPLAGASAAEPASVGMFIQGVDETIAKAMGLDRPRGVLVRDIALGGPADRGGFQRGDLIVRFAGQEVTSVAMMQGAVGELAIGREVEATVVRRGAEVALALTPERRPEKHAVSHGAVVQMPETGLTLSTLTSKVRERFGLRWGSTGVVVTVLDETKTAFMDLRQGEVIVQVAQEDVWDPEQVAKAVASARQQGRNALLMLVEGPSGFRFSILPVR